MYTEILQLAPRAVWNHFYQLSQIPRPSHHERAVQDHVMGIGEQLGLEVVRDASDNILIRKPATAGMEDAPGVILQGHLDMVPQANSDSEHDFSRDPIPLRIEQEWLTAAGTTLGADNGIGVAAALAVLESHTIRHGPIEALFTSNEEDGMSGASGLESGLLQGKILLNMDSEDEGVLCIGCAGGANATTRLHYTAQPRPAGSLILQLSVSGLRGGHSGIDIDKGRGNANRLLFRLLSLAQMQEIGFRLGAVHGGNMRNAIPREATALLTVEPSAVDSLMGLMNRARELIKAEFAAVEPNLDISLEQTDAIDSLLPEQEQSALIDALSVCPNGVIRMSDSMPGLVETSSNLAIVRIASGEVEIKSLIRSSVDSSRDELCAMHQALFRLIGAETVIDGEYPGWKPNANSPLLQIMRKAYQDIFDASVEIGAIHAGLECGVIGGRYPALDMISFGPTIRSPHSPDERVHIPSVQRFWDLLVTTLGRL